MDHGSLYDLLHNETMIMEGELLLTIIQDVSQGVRFLHTANPQVIHGDLKAANILVDSRFRAKVADFGLSQNKNLGGTATPFWMAPELLRRESINTAETDVYSFGVILYEVYSRKDPYEGEDPKTVLSLVADKSVRKRPPVPKNAPPQMQSLMTDCLCEEPEKRPSFEELDVRVKRIDVKSADPGQTGNKASSISLFDIFPRHIAETLQAGRTVEPEHRDSVTIFFSDIVGFTNISSTLPPRKVANMLDRLYTKLDALSNTHDIFKVETIGDAYMAVTNLVKDQPDDHAKRIAEFAIDAIVAANGTYIDIEDHSKGFVNIRVGFHSGSIVADVVGTRNPRYCLFGDAVNTSSRMESNSKVNRIHCSSDAADLLKVQCPEMPLKSRGRIPIKGKGKLHTFWVNETQGAPKLKSISTLDQLSRTEQHAEDSDDNMELVMEEASCDFEEFSTEVLVIESPPESASSPKVKALPEPAPTPDVGVLSEESAPPPDIEAPRELAPSPDAEAPPEPAPLSDVEAPPDKEGVKISIGGK
jgi:class 3 adenylate cyclase